MNFEPSQPVVFVRGEDPAMFAEQLREREQAGWEVLIMWAVPQANEYAAIMLKDGGALEETQHG